MRGEPSGSFRESGDLASFSKSYPGRRRSPAAKAGRVYNHYARAEESAHQSWGGSRRIEDAQDVVLGYFQPSLAGLFLTLTSTQD
jgi:hypothetical protein